MPGKGQFLRLAPNDGLVNIKEDLINFKNNYKILLIIKNNIKEKFERKHPFILQLNHNSSKCVSINHFKRFSIFSHFSIFYPPVATPRDNDGAEKFRNSHYSKIEKTSIEIATSIRVILNYTSLK